jgi:capsular exopolysaccharide synthesis family protein
VENDISEFKSANLIPASSSDVASIYVGQASTATAQTTEINNQLLMARYVRNYLTNEANKYTLIPANQGVNSPNISGQITEYNTLLLSRNNLLSASSLQNPLIQEKDLQLEELRNALIASVDNHIASLNVELRSAQAIRGQANSKIASSPSQSKYLLSVERQQKVKESLYLYLLQKREENELSRAFTAYNTRVITSASGSNIPTFPVPKTVWLIGIIFGLAIPGVIIFLLETINNKVRGRRDLNELTIPFIGEIPMYRHHRTWKEKLFGPWVKLGRNLKSLILRTTPKEDKTLHILVKDHSRNVINEAFRVIRTNIEFMTAKGGRGKVIMLTSFDPNSGKTFVVTNLITSFAIKKQKVLAIDLDLRKSSLSAMVNKPKIGISDYLSGVTDSFDDIVIRDATHRYLDIVPVGTVPPNPTELLFDDRLAELLEKLRDEYAYIILDCPPIEIVADATIVGRNADATLFVIRAEVLDRSLLPDIQKYYDEGKLPKMSLILNGTTDAFSYYGNHRYGSRYGYYGGSSYGGYTKDDD